MIIFDYIIKAAGLLVAILIGLFILYTVIRVAAVAWETGIQNTRRRIKYDRYKSSKRPSQPGNKR